MNKFTTDKIFKPKPAGLGIRNAIKYVLAARKTTFRFTAFNFKVLTKLSKITQYPILGHIYKYFMMLTPYDSRHTQSVVLPFNIDVREDLRDKTQNLVLPIDLMKKLVREVSYRLALDKCVCRLGNNCSDFPHDIGCLFMGEAGKITEKMGLGREVTAEEAEAIIDRAASLGLVGQTLWVEAEQFLWGWRNEKMDRFLELCFCCPCCCSALAISRNSTIDVRSRWKSAGWKSHIDENCINCGKCIEICPQRAITHGTSIVTVDQDACIGCGLCKQVCPNNAVKIHLMQKPMSDLRDYFSGLDLKL